ncbi:hypothetical protein E8E13_000163 [Curvularia kusanoi]|uniref:Uncharacterized protein n=1 Tax=Curvularia kusanoi TaxID=90978 RepID=A0A9P4TD42_CURKU|nr:hypothetical protein E8E13_000163 [Curvularia kusanoi]
MPPLDHIQYSRDHCIAAIQDYYSFLTKMYLDEDLLLEPPEGGWPNTTAKNMRGFDKTDEVLALLRHLPYIDSGNNGIAHGSARCFFADWPSLAGNDPKRDASTLKWTIEDDFDDEVPAHVVGLTSSDNDLSFFLLDTKLGIVHWRACPHQWRYNQVREKITDDPDDYAPGEAWRGDAPAWAIVDFFEILKDHLRTLNFVPISNRNVLYAESGNPELDAGAIPMVKKIYRAHGWPDLEEYRKEECLMAIRTAMETNHPSVSLDP